MIQCIGITENGQRCTATSEKPSHPRWPDIYLCPQCANQPPRKGSRNSAGIVLERPVSA
jgi:hypothetical protein